MAENNGRVVRVEEPAWGPDIILALKSAGVVSEDDPPVRNVNVIVQHEDFATLQVDFVITYEQLSRIFTFLDQESQQNDSV